MAGTVSPVLLLVTVSCLLCVASAVLSVCPEPLQLGESYTIPVNISSPQSLCYILDSNTNKQALKWHGIAHGALVEHPVLVTIKQPRGVSSLSVPFLENGFAHRELYRILCPLLNIGSSPDESEDSLLLIDLTTSSPQSINFTLEIHTIKSFELQLDKPRTLLSSPSSPSFMVFEFPEDLNHVSVKVSASEETRNICAIASIQNVLCPSVELLDNPENRGKFQSMKSIAKFNVKKHAWKINYKFFYVVVSVFPTDGPQGNCDFSKSNASIDTELLSRENLTYAAGCNFGLTNFTTGTRVKKVSIIVEPGLSNETYIIAVSVMVVFMLTFYIVSFTWITVDEWWYYRRSTVDKVNEEAGYEEEMPSGTSLDDSLSVLEEESDEGSPKEEAKEGNGTMPAQKGPPPPSTSQIPAPVKKSPGTRRRVFAQSSPKRRSPPVVEPRRSSEPDRKGSLVVEPRRSSDLNRKGSLVVESRRSSADSQVTIEERESVDEVDDNDKAPTLVSVLTGNHWNKEKKKVVLKRQRSLLYNVGASFSAHGPPPPPSAAALKWKALSKRQDSILRLGAEENESESSQSTLPDDGDSTQESKFKYDKHPFPVNVYLSELGKIDETQSAYDFYPHYIFVAGAFYALPVFQLLNTYIWFTAQGNEDVCYFNYLCANPLTIFGIEFYSFNNAFSNISYLALGTLMILLACRRRSHYQLYNEINLERPPDKKVGMPHQFGIYYAIGMAMIGQSVLSTAYHMCPTKDNFRFDATFIYIQTGLGIHKFIQTRVPDKNAKLHEIMILFVGVLLTVIIGNLDYDNVLFWAPFVFVYMLITVIFAVESYYRWEISSWKDFQELLQFWSTDGIFPPRHKTKFAHSTATVLFNGIIAAYGFFNPTPKFANFIMYILLGNDMLHLVAYLSSKFVHKELTLKTQPVKIGVVSVLAIVCWLVGFYYFAKDSTEWSMTPAQSRDKNLDCEFLGFYDSHDIWHFFGAFAIFFTTMLVMTVDDTMETRTRDKILIF